MFQNNDNKAAKNLNNKYDFEIALAGNPNVGKSTIFNSLTGLNQHTGNWTGKTVENAYGFHKYKDNIFKIVDLPGTYSLETLSKEEQVAKEYLENKTFDCVVAVVDTTNLQRNLNLVLQIMTITKQVILCLNMADEAKKKGIIIDTDELSLQLGIPVVETSANKPSTLSKLKEKIYDLCNKKIKTYDVKSLKLDEIKTFDNKDDIAQLLFDKINEICKYCVKSNDQKRFSRDRKIDKILTSKLTGIPIMVILLAALFWITAVGANYPSMWLADLFDFIKQLLIKFFDFLKINATIKSLFVDGIYNTLSMVVSVMLPPMAIFFPLFSLMEDFGYLPRIAFNLDSCFRKAGAHSKQSLTMAMGFGCNACGVMGCRIIDSKKERKIAIITNNFMPCNGRLPALIAISTIFFSVTSYALLNSLISALSIVLLIIISIIFTLFVSKILSKTIYKGQPSSFMLELPPYRKPQILKTIIYSLTNRALYVLKRAVFVAIPAGVVIWCMTNIKIDNIALLDYCTNFLEPFAKFIGLDGVIIMAFILSLPANEMVLPVILMSYLSSSTFIDYSSYSQLGENLISNGWTITTAICFLILCLFHYPCSTTAITIYKETKSIKDTLLSMIIPTVVGISLCFITNQLFSLFHIVF